MFDVLELAKKNRSHPGCKKGQEIKLLEIKNLSTLGDYFLIASANNARLVQALADEVEEQLKKDGIYPKRVEGYQSAQWILMDNYDVMIHIFYDDTQKVLFTERLGRTHRL
jgi:ribosome-associated protein